MHDPIGRIYTSLAVKGLKLVAVGVTKLSTGLFYKWQSDLWYIGRVESPDSSYQSQKLFLCMFTFKIEISIV